jgi:hypothetical protein
MTRSSRGAALLVVSLGIILVSACANTVARPAADTPTGVQPSDFPQTIERIVSGTADEVAALGRLQFAEAEAAVADCMTSRGFEDEYIPARLIQSSSPAFPHLFLPPLPLAEAEAHGWGIIEAIIHPSPGPDIPQDPEFSPAYQDAFGECENRRDDAETTPSPGELLSESVREELSAASQSVFEDSGFEQAFDAYSSCMASHGDEGDVYPPQEGMFQIKERAKSASGSPDGQEVLAGLLEEEKALAVADSTCRTQELYRDMLDARARVEAAAIQEHRDLLDEISAAWADIVERAPSRADVSQGLVD